MNALLCAKQQTNIVPKFSAPQLIKPKPSNTAVNSGSVSTAIQTIEKPKTKPPPSSPLRKSSLPLKVQKVVGATSSGTTAINTTVSSQPPSSATLTVQQVQAMLNKPGLNVASTVLSSSSTTMAAAATTTTSSMQLIISSTIKAAISPTNKVLATPTHTDNVKALQTSIAPSTSAGVSKASSVSNSTLTISKVQSFGTQSQKNQNSSNTETNLQSFATPAPALAPTQGQIILNNISERLPSPPSHIQYGYIVSASYASHKFVAKRVTEEFYVKVPKVGILKLQGLGAVNTYLNK